MSLGNEPLTVETDKTLSELGVSPENIRYGFLTLESELYACVKDTDPSGKNILRIFDLKNDYRQDKFPMNGESAIMNPNKKWLAIRGGVSLQVFDAEKKQKVCSMKIEDEEIVFWTWLTSDVIGVVTKTSCFHWKISMGDSELSKIFEISEKLRNSQIVAYKMSSDSKWLVLTGIAKEGTEIAGNTQLYSVDKGVSQPLSSHAASFCNVLKEDETEKRSVFAFIEKKVGAKPKLFIMELDKTRADSFKLTPSVIQADDDDFPLSLLFSEDQQCLYLITKNGYVQVFDVLTGKQLLRKQVTTETTFASVLTQNQQCVIGITVKTGNVLKIQLDKANLVPYLLNEPSLASLAVSFAKRLNLPGAEQLFEKAFSTTIVSSPLEAAKIAATAPNDMLRNIDNLNKLRAGGNALLLEYFKLIMKRSKLNDYETLELAKLVVSQKKHATLEKLIKEGKITLTEKLGDLLMHQKNLATGSDSSEILRLAVGCYMKAENNTDSCKQKAVEGLVQMNETSKIVAYCNKVGFTPNYNTVIENLIRSNPKSAETFAKQLANTDEATRNALNVTKIVDTFLSFNHIQEATSFLIDFLKNDKEEEAKLQTKLIQMNIEQNQMNVVEAILSNDILHFYDKGAIAAMLEEKKHYKRALGMYNDLPAVKRVLNKLLTDTYSNTTEAHPAQAANEEYIKSFCARRSKENLIDILSEMIQVFMLTNNANCLKLVVNICVDNVERLGAFETVKFLEGKSNQSFDSTESIFLYTSQVINTTFVTKNIVLKLIETGCKLSQFDVIVKVIRENSFIPAIQEKVKNFLFIEKFSDPRPLIHLCDRLQLVQELTGYLVQNGLFQHLKVYVDKVNPKQASQVIIKLLDLNTADDMIKSLLDFDTVKTEMNYEYLVEELEKRNKLFFIKDLLEEQVFQQKTQNSVVHNALAKMYILTNNNPEEYLSKYDGYDAIAIGDFAEKIDPNLAFTCYEKSNNEEKIIALCFKHDLFEKLTFYCLEKENIELWTKIFKNEELDNTKVQIFLDTSVSSTSLSKAAPELSKISALIKALLPVSFKHLLILLEHLILSSNSTLTEKEKQSNLLQNLLFLSATKVKPEKIMSFIKDDKLNNYELNYVSSQLLAADLKKEAVEVYKKFGKFKEAVEVMLSFEDIDDLESTVTNWLEHMQSSGNFDENKKKEVLSVIGKHALEKGLIPVATKYLTEAENAEDYIEVIRKGIEFKQHEPLIEYLRMCRKKVKDVSIDSTLAYALAMCNKKKELEEFIMMPNLTQVNPVGERLLTSFKQNPSEDLFECAVMLFSHENNHVKLCEVFLAKGEFKRALESAKKANRVESWTLVVKEAVEHGEMTVAKVSALNIINTPQSLEVIMKLYKDNARIEELITLFEDAVTALDTVNSSIYTSLAVLYGEYTGFIASISETMLLEFVTKNISKLNIARVVKVCEDNLRLKETFEILKLTNELEKALELLFKFSGEVFEHSKIVELLQAQNTKGCIRNETLYYKLLSFYFEYAPLKVSNLLISIQNNYVKDISPVLDINKVIKIANDSDNLPLLKDFFIEVRKVFSAYSGSNSYETKSNPILSYNISSINEALNDLFIEEDDYNSLRQSVDEHENFDHLKLAAKLQSSDLSQFRMIAAKLFMKKKKYSEAMNICEQDNKYDECLFFAKTSQNRSVCSDLLLKFGKKKNKKYFLSLLTLCSDLVAPDIVLEIAWKNNWTEFTMPFMIDHLRKTTERLDLLENQLAVITEQKNKQQEEEKKKASLLNNGSANTLMNSF